MLTPAKGPTGRPCCALVSLLLITLVLSISCHPKVPVKSQAAHTSTTASSPPSAGQGGTSDGELAVDDSGAAVYTVPIRVPPGTGGMQPELSLRYVSSRRYGLAGIGWGLDGLSTITRVGANIRQDGFRGGVDYGPNDRFQLDDQRLIEVPDASGTGTHYRTAIESWRRVQPSFKTDQNESCGAGPCWFSVSEPDGRLLEYGRTADSRARAQGTSDVRVWVLNKVTDLHGNAMTISYTATPCAGMVDEGQYYPVAIHYTFNEALGLTAQRSVELHYEQRPDVRTLYVGGHAVVTRARLTSISTHLDGLEVTRFTLTYEPKPSPATAMSRLTSITECAGSSGVCLPATRFTWQDGTPAFIDKGAWLSSDFVHSWDPHDPRYLADVNGDGLTDIVGFRNDTQVSLATGTKFDKAGSWNSGFAKGWSAQTPRLLADVTGDGMADIVGFNFSGVQVAPSTGKSFDEKQWSSQSYPYFGKDAAAGGWVEDRHPRLIVDVNGDGLGDIVGFKDKTYVGLSAGDHFEPPASWNDSDFTGDAWWQNEERLRLLGDVNGDGVADIVGFSSDHVIVGVSTGNRTKKFDLSAWPQNKNGGYGYFCYNKGWRASKTPIMLADVNGDGLSDIVGFKDGVQVGLSTGKGFLPPTQWNSGFGSESSPPWREENTRTLADVNGDGLADVVGFSTTGVVVALSTGSQFNAADWNEKSLPDYVSSTGNLLMTSADVNGDGKSDIITFGGKKGSSTTVNVGLSDGRYPDLLTGIVNGLGGQLRIAYTPLTDKAVYTAASSWPQNPAVRDSRGFFAPTLPFFYSSVVSSYPIVNAVGGTIYVVKGVDETLGSGSPIASTKYSDLYTYTAARFDLLLDAWLGFEHVSRVSTGDGRKTVTSYNQEYPKTGTKMAVAIECADRSPDPSCTPGAVVRRDVYSYESAMTATGVGPGTPAVNQVILRAQHKERFTYGKYDHSIGTTYSYDAYGNPTVVSYLGLVTQKGADLDSSDNVYSCTSYFNDVSGSAWKIGFAQNSKQSSVSSCDDFESFHSETDLSLSTIDYDLTGGTMNVLQSRRWDDRAGKYLTYKYAYDGYGNKTSTTDPQGNTTITTYDANYHSFPATSKSPLISGEGNRTLSFTYQYDARFGTKVAEVDPNGNAEVSCLDGLGRLYKAQVSKPTSNTVTDDSCLPGSSVGSEALVTIETHEHKLDSQGTAYVDIAYLQDWPTGHGRSELHALRFYDGRGRVYKRSVQADPSQGDLIECVLYDQYNRPLKLSYPYFGAIADGCSPTATQIPWRTIGYDVAGRVSRRSRPNGPTGAETIVTTYSYPGELTATVSEADNTPYAYVVKRQYAYFNGRRALTRLSIPSDGNAVSTFDYDRVGRLIGATDPQTASNPKGVSSTFTYDSLGRRVGESSPDRGTATFDYKGTEWLQAATDGDGTTSYTYDELGRIKTVVMPKGTVFQYGYDEVAATNGAGRLTSSTVKDGTGAAQSSYRYSYDPMGYQSGVALSLDGGDYTSQYRRDPMGRPRQTVFPDGSVLAREYSYGNLKSLTLDKVTYVTFGAYTPFNKPQSIMYSTSGVSETWSIYPTGEPYRHMIRSTSGELYLDKSVSWNGLRLVSGVLDNLKRDGSDLSESYEYTNRRISSATGPDGTRSFAYDPSGNLTVMNDVTFMYNAHRPITGKSGGKKILSVAYDALGRMTEKTTEAESYRFDYADASQLASVTKAGKVIESYTYDAGGRRLISARPGGAKTLYVSPDYEVTKDGARVDTVRYLSTNDAPVAMIKLSNGAAELTAIHLDHLGSTVLTTDGNGQIKDSYRYLPYGALSSGSASSDPSSKFTGKRLDASSGLYYFGSRYYDPFLGRFISPDDQTSGGLTRQDSQNLYAYALNAPSSLIDSSGHCPEVVAGAAVATGAVIAETSVDVATAAGTAVEVATVVDATTASGVGGTQMLAGGTLEAADAGSALASEAGDLAGQGGAIAEGGGPRNAGDVTGEMKDGGTTTKKSRGIKRSSPDSGFGDQSGAQDPFHGYEQGQGFTGVYDAQSKRVMFRPSTSDPNPPEGWVRRNGGHGSVSRMLGGKPANHLGFAAVIQQDGSINLTWKSGVLNRRYPESLVPKESQDEIRKAVEKMTLRSVNK